MDARCVSHLHGNVEISFGDGDAPSFQRTPRAFHPAVQPLRLAVIGIESQRLLEVFDPLVDVNLEAQRVAADGVRLDVGGIPANHQQPGSCMYAHARVFAQLEA